MFGVDWSDSETLWINLTNLAMGVIVLLAVAGAAWALFLDLRDKRKAKSAARAEADAAIRARAKLAMEPRQVIEGWHSYFEPELGMTFADGGEPEDEEYDHLKPPFED